MTWCVLIGLWMLFHGMMECKVFGMWIVSEGVEKTRFNLKMIQHG